MQIGPVKYSKKEESLFFKSYTIGLLSALPLAAVLFLLFPFAVQSANDFIGWIAVFYQLTGRLIIPWFLVTGAFFWLQSTKKRLIRSVSDIARMLWVLFIFFPVLFTYLIVIGSAIFVPLDKSTMWLGPVRQYWLVMLLCLPFLFLFMLIFLPETKPRKIIWQAWLVVKGEKSFPRMSLHKSIQVAIISVWLFFVFLPLPNVPFTNLVVIGGGIVVAALLVRDRFNAKKRDREGRRD